MFGWFRPACPCYPLAKTWVEQRLLWLNEQFPSNIYTGKGLVLPTDDFFPEPYTPTERGARGVLEIVGHHMGVDTRRISLEFIHDPNKLSFVNASGQALAHTAGTYSGSAGTCLITIDTDELGHPSDLIATFAHELSHARLLGEGRMHAREFDHELTTDLTAVALGFGLFMANSPRVWESQYSQWPRSTKPRPKYMIPPMYGYALAHLAWIEKDDKPLWAHYLGTASKADFWQGVKYLFSTGDTAFHPEPAPLAEVRVFRRDPK